MSFISKLFNYTIAFIPFIIFSAISLSLNSISFIAKADTHNNLNQSHTSRTIDSNQNLFHIKTYPQLPSGAKSIADLIYLLEILIRELDILNPLLPDIAHQQQVLYRQLSKDINLSNDVLSRLPETTKLIAHRHLEARRQFLTMSKFRPKPEHLPAWEIISPVAPKKLLSYYKKAESLTGIDWEILAAINLVETGMGRISGLSIAGAKGPMQFLQTTWDLPGIGNGLDINNPEHSIHAAARYLVHRGGLKDIKKGLWGYNNSDYYGNAVIEYANILKDDPRSFNGFYYWEIHFNSVVGDIWLPVGYKQKQSIPISAYLNQFPASAPPHYSSNK